MPFFENRNEDDYRKAAEAVRNGTANSNQKHLNDRASKLSGPMGNRARDALK